MDNMWLEVEKGRQIINESPCYDLCASEITALRDYAVVHGWLYAVLAVYRYGFMSGIRYQKDKAEKGACREKEVDAA